MRMPLRAAADALGSPQARVSHVPIQSGACAGLQRQLLHDPTPCAQCPVSIDTVSTSSSSEHVDCRATPVRRYTEHATLSAPTICLPTRACARRATSCAVVFVRLGVLAPPVFIHGSERARVMRFCWTPVLYPHGSCCRLERCLATSCRARWATGNRHPGRVYGAPPVALELVLRLRPTLVDGGSCTAVGQ